MPYTVNSVPQWPVEVHYWYNGTHLLWGPNYMPLVVCSLCFPIRHFERTVAMPFTFKTRKNYMVWYCAPCTLGSVRTWLEQAVLSLPVECVLIKSHKRNDSMYVWDDKILLVLLASISEQNVTALLLANLQMRTPSIWISRVDYIQK